MFQLVVICILFFAQVFCGNHTNNWAVLVGTSRFWFNYRHQSNTLGMYEILKQNGFHDDHIILMLADDVACDPRNIHPAQVFSDKSKKKNLYRDDVQVDYRGYEVTVENFLRVLQGRHDPSVPKNKRMMSDENSNVLVYMTGHGGDEFLKFQDIEEITAEEIKQTVFQMKLKKRFHQMLMIVDTCQAGTLYQRIDTEGVVTLASSILHESSYSHSNDKGIGVSLIDRFTYYTLEYFEKNSRKIFKKNEISLQDFFDSFTYEKLGAHHTYRNLLVDKELSEVPVSDFFSSSIDLEVIFDENEEEEEEEEYLFKEEKLSSSQDDTNKKKKKKGEKEEFEEKEIGRKKGIGVMIKKLIEDLVGNDKNNNNINFSFMVTSCSILILIFSTLLV